MENAEFGTVKFTLADNVELEMVKIPAYKGTMDDVPDEKMAEIRQEFMIGKYPVTQEQYEAVMGCNPSVFKGAKRPVENVTWAEAKEFCEKLNEMIFLEGFCSFNLPTQFQWNYVAKSRGTVPSEDEEAFGEFAWFGKNADGETHEVGQKSPNPYGLYDLYGNVYEWCDAEWENAGKPGCPTPEQGNAMRVAPGGSWDDNADTCVEGVALSGVPELRQSTIGFRVAIVPDVYIPDMFIDEDEDEVENEEEVEEEEEVENEEEENDEDVFATVQKVMRKLEDRPEPEDYENLPEQVFDPVKERMHGPYKRYMHCEDEHAVINDNTAIVIVYDPMQVTVYRNHKDINVYGNNVHAEVMANEGYIRFCSNNAKVTVSGNGVVDVMGHGNEVTVMGGTVHVYGENTTVLARGGFVDVHGMHSKVVVSKGKATVMDSDCQELRCDGSGELLLPDNSKVNYGSYIKSYKESPKPN